MPSSDEFDTFLSDGKRNLAVFMALDVDELGVACPGDDAAAIMGQAKAFSTELDELVSDYDKVYDSMSCESIAPLVQKAVYETACGSIPRGLVWTFASGLCLAFFGTILVSLRSATLRPQIYLVQANNMQSNDDDSYIVDSDDSRY